MDHASTLVNTLIIHNDQSRKAQKDFEEKRIKKGSYDIWKISHEATTTIACEQAHLWVTRGSDLRAKRSGGQESGAVASRGFAARV